MLMMLAETLYFRRGSVLPLQCPIQKTLEVLRLSYFECNGTSWYIKTRGKPCKSRDSTSVTKHGFLNNTFTVMYPPCTVCMFPPTVTRAPKV